MASKNSCTECTQAEALNLDYENVRNGDAPTNWWHCAECGAHMARYRGETDQTCRCGAEYNSGGQRLRDDWRQNSSLYDEEIGDLEGYEIGHVGDE